MTQSSIETLIEGTVIGDVLRVKSTPKGKQLTYEGRVQSKRTFTDARWRVEFEGGAFITPGLNEGNPPESELQRAGPEAGAPMR